MQAALLTIMNTGKRAFLGGVFVAMPEGISLIIKWPFSRNLNNAVTDLGGILIQDKDIGSNFCIHLGIPASIDDNSIEVVCNGWVGGICNGVDKVNFQSPVDFSLGGILAGALGV